jgi:hypothetical protein
VEIVNKYNSIRVEEVYRLKVNTKVKGRIKELPDEVIGFAMFLVLIMAGLLFQCEHKEDDSNEPQDWQEFEGRELGWSN